MLHQSAVSLSLLQVLEGLQDKIAGTGFALAGGTSLALRLGHRLSVDLDFFATDAFDPETLAGCLKINHEAIIGLADGTLQAIIRGIKVEFLRHAYPQLAGHEMIDHVRMWSLQDVCAMKLNAIANRGSKKDFYDIAELLGHFPLSAMINHYQAKYRPASLLMVIRSLAWFEDAETEPDPISLNGNSWIMVKDIVSRAIRTLQ